MLNDHPALAPRSRFLTWTEARGSVQTWELATLLGCGFVASLAVAFLDMSLRIPGHAILRSVLPISFGMALIPRRGAGWWMSSGALTGVLVMSLQGVSMGIGATTSLLTVGPLIDFASRKARRGWQLAMAFGFAGMFANLLALIVRSSTKLGGGSGRGGGWWSIAPMTYAVCGLVAGAICAVIFFRMRSKAFSDNGSQKS